MLPIRTLITVLAFSIIVVQLGLAQEPRGAVRNAPSVPKEPDSAPGGGQRTGQPARESRFSQQKSVWQKFKEFQGEKTASSLKALFAGGVGGIVQDPPIAIADGQSIIHITLNLGNSLQSVPVFALKGARVISIKPGAKGGWMIEAQTVKGAYDGAVTALTADAMTEYPLVMAPSADVDLDKSGSVNESDFELYLGGNSAISSGEATSAPAVEQPSDTNRPAQAAETSQVKRDLNGDGKEDSLDDYIFTANYLVATASNKQVK